MDLDLDQTLRVGERKAQQMREILTADSRFLRKMGIIDYSLLVGIHHINRHVPSGDGPLPTFSDREEEK